ncbi:MAG: choice-of-anchor J domain-containing protein [Bacteroidetes bacterium]|nr:choice-of-anchor J domain-containing protein [Bacteroidota bacterium]
MTRKIYLSILALLLATFSLSAQNPKVKIGNVTSGPGEILVPFEMLDFTQPVNSFTFKITANSSLLQFVEVVNRVGFTGPNFQAYQNGNTLSIIYFDIGAGYTPNGKIFDLKFNYTAAANTTLSFIANQQEVTSGINPIANIDYINGNITTTLPIPDPVVDIADVTVAPGAVNIGVEMLNFTNNVNSFTFNLNLPGALLQYVDLQNINPALGAGTLQANQTGNTLQIQWFTNGAGFVPSGTVFQMRFNYVGGFNTDILWLPGSEVTYGPNPVAPISFIKGSVTQVPAVGTVSVGSASVPTGASVSLPVQFNGTGLNNVAAFTLFLQFDQSSLVFAGFSNPIAPELVVNHNNGLISMAWNGAATNFNSASIVNLNFVYTGVVPANLQFLPGCEVNNALATPLPISYQNGTVSPAASTSIMKIADVTGFAGQTISVPVNATDIGTVGALDLIINWNPQQATLASYSANQLTNWVVNQGAGNIYFQWQDIAGATVNNGEVVTLHFVYHGGGNMPVTFANGSEVTGTNGLPKVVSFQHGSIAQNFSNAQAVIGTVNSCSGNTAIVPVNLVDVGIVSSFSFSIGYTGSVLTYVELINVNPALTGLQVNQVANTLNVQWQNVNPVNLNGKLFDIVFSYAGAANSPVVFNAGSEITGVGATVLPITYVNGAVNCNIETRTLTVNTSGMGSVVVMDGMTVLLPDANTTNQYTVEYGKVLTLEATGDLGWQFANWDGPVNNLTSATTTISMINNAFVTANFTMIDYTLTLLANPAEGGVVTGAGIYNFGQVVAVDAIPNTGYAFVNWTDGNGNVVSTQPANNITMPASDLTLTANFVLIDYTLTLVANPAEGGTVTGGGVYNYNQQVAVDAIPNTGYEFVNWTDGNGNVVSTVAANTITMPASDLTLTANFALINYTLTLVANPTAGGTVTGAGVYTFGQQVAVDAIPNEGYSFVNWTDSNGNVVSTQPANVITMPASDLTLTANFALNNYTLTLVANPAAGGTVTGGGTYPFGTVVAVDAIPNSGWEFVNWTDANGNVVSTQPANNITIPASDLTLTANFELTYVAPFPFSENFEGEDFPPQYWNRYRLGTGSTVREWVRSTAQNHTTGGTASAFHNYGPSSQTEDGWLVTPKIQLPANRQNIELRFWSYNIWPTYYGKNSVLISTTDGTPGAAFTEVWTTPTVAQSWVETVVDLTAYAGQQIFIAFRYEGSDAHGWYLDDVTVDYEPAQFPVITVNPASLSTEVEQGMTAAQTLTVGNTGNAALDFTVAIEYVTSKSNTTPATKPNIGEGPVYGENEPAQGNAQIIPQGSKSLATRDQLYDNGPFINSPGTGPGGSDESILQNSTLGMNTLGAGIQYASGNRMADDVVVPETWNVESITVYAYQTGSTTTSTMTGGYIQVWDGDPTQGGQIIWGDMTTNRMTATGWTNTYRRSETTPGTTRPIMYLVVETPGLTLEPGTYWIDYSLAGSLASGPWAPPITINGQAVTGNAKQFLGSSQTWQDFLDTGTGTPAQGLPFIISGTTGGGGPVQWLSVNPLAGSVNAGASSSLDVTYDATGLEVGTYNANIVISSNDPSNPTVTVPVTMTVTPSTICYPEPRNLTSSVNGQNVILNWQAPELGGGGGGGGTVKLDEGFEGDFPPAGWVKLNPDGGTGWTSLNAGTTPIPGWQGGTATPAPEGGNKMAFCTWNTGGTTANDQWIVTPQITVENGDQLRFYVRYAFSSYNDNFDVRISTTSQNDPAAFTTVVAEMNFTSTTTTEWQLMSFNLTDFVPAGSQIYIGFREHVLDNFNDGSAIMLDNVYVGPATRSAQPVAYNLQSQIGRSNGQILPERGCCGLVRATMQL